MPISGPPPKEGGALRRNKPTFERTEVTADGERHGPNLPIDFDWHPRTIDWWEKWQFSAQAQVMTEHDWEMLLETALLHTRFWYGKMSAAQHVALAGEIRRRTASLGATFEDRMKLRMFIVGDETNVTDDEIASAAADGVDYFNKMLAKAAELTQEVREE